MKNKVVAAMLAFFLGSFGAHRFYLRDAGAGIFYLFLFFITARLRFPISFILGIIDGIRYLTMSDEAFDRKYNKGRAGGKRSARDIRKESARKRSDYSRRSLPKSNPFKKSGIKKYKEFDLEDAIEDFKKGLEIEPNDQALHFNIACAYSLTEQKNLALVHLDQAVQNGFKDFKKIDTHDDLAFIRIQEEFDTFKENGYRLKQEKAATTTKTKKKEAPQEDNLLDDDILLSQLNKLAELRKKGLLSEKEFQEEKKKLLRQ